MADAQRRARRRASGATAAFGKQQLSVLLLSVKSSDTLSATHPATRAPLAGSAPDVLTQALRRVRARMLRARRQRGSRSALRRSADARAAPPA